MSKKCLFCSAILEDEDVFCDECGKKQDETAATEKVEHRTEDKRKEHEVVAATVQEEVREQKAREEAEAKKRTQLELARRIKAEAEARAEAERKAKAEAEAKERERAETELRIKAEAEAKVRLEAEQKAKAEKERQRAEQMRESRDAVAKASKTAMHTIVSIICWLLGLSCVLLGLMFVSDAIVMSVTWILAGLLILPPVTKLVPSFKGRKIVIILACVILLFIGIVSFPAA